MANDLIKNDINFLEYPMWILAEKTGSQEYKMSRQDGSCYEMSTSADRLPDRLDKIVLFALMADLAKAKFNSYEVKTTRYKLAQMVFGRDANLSKAKYDRLSKALSRWHKISLSFYDSFYENEIRTERHFHIIETFSLDRVTRKLEVRFNSDFVNQIKDSEYYKLIDFQEYRKLKQPVAARLYEILIKSFNVRSVWEIEALTLAEKLTLRDKYPSKIYPRIKSALREINGTTDIKTNLAVRKGADGQTILIFTKDSGSTSECPLNSVLLADPTLEVLKEHRTLRVVRIISRFTGPRDVLLSNIRLANRAAVKNYAGFLRIALKEDWAAADREKENELRPSLVAKIENSLEEIKLTIGSNDSLIAGECAFRAALEMRRNHVAEVHITPDQIIKKVRQMISNQTD